MKYRIISSTEKGIFQQIEANNKDEVSLWRISNVAIPFVTIVLSLLSYSMFKPDAKIEFLTYFNLLLNGSIPMIALSRIGGMGVYFFKYDRGKEKQYGIADTYMLRTKIGYLFVLILVGTMFLYIYQISHNPFRVNFSAFTILAFSAFSVYCSLSISKKVYLLQDKLIDKTFDQEIREDLTSKGHGNNW